MEKKVIYAILAVFLVQLLGIFLVDVAEIDSAQYASIAWEMLRTGSWLQVFDQGIDYLDKPPLLFWTAAATYNILGVSDVAFRLIPFLVSFLIGGFSCYRFCKLYYTKQTGWVAFLFYVSSQAVFLMATDLRTDSLLTSFVILSITEIAYYLERKTWKHLIIAGVGIGVSMLAKGPIGLIVPAFAVGTHLLIKGQYKSIFNPRWLVMIGISLLPLIPMCVGLYQQFDAQPEKLIGDKTGVSGLRFFFWTQSFGRITGESGWQNHSDPFFFVHTYLWSSLPWCILTLFGLYFFFRNAKKATEYMTIGGLVLTTLALSQSAYKLPHYINVVLPFGSIIAAWFTTTYLLQATKNTQRVILSLQGFLLLALWTLMGVVLYTVFTPQWEHSYLLILLPALAYTIYAWKKAEDSSQRILFPSIVTLISLNFFLNTFFYPQLMTYQAPSAVGKWVKEKEIPLDKFFVYDNPATHSLSFYAGKVVPTLTHAMLQKQEGTVWLYITDEQAAELKQAGVKVTVCKEFQNYPITRLKAAFLNQSTREQVTERVYVVEIQKG